MRSTSVAPAALPRHCRRPMPRAAAPASREGLAEASDGSAAPARTCSSDRLGTALAEGQDANVLDAQRVVRRRLPQALAGGRGRAHWRHHRGAGEVQLLYAGLSRRHTVVQAGWRRRARASFRLQNSAGDGIQGWRPTSRLLEVRWHPAADRYRAASRPKSVSCWPALVCSRASKRTSIALRTRERGIRRPGFTDVQLRAVLMQIRCEIAPYIGISWTRRLGDTADIARAWRPCDRPRRRSGSAARY